MDIGTPTGSGESEAVYEDDFYLVTDDPDEQMVSVALIERGLILRFDYEEFREFATLVERTRTFVQLRLDNAAKNGR